MIFGGVSAMAVDCLPSDLFYKRKRKSQSCHTTVTSGVFDRRYPPETILNGYEHLPQGLLSVSISCGAHHDGD